jgi:hypothetical protein
VEVGRRLQECGTAAGQEPGDKYRFLADLQALRHPALEAFPQRPVIGINLEAPQRTIIQAVEQFVRQEKEQQGIKERRRRDDKLDEYLAVWDQREGWLEEGRYDHTRERTLQEIAKETKLPLSTAANRYRSAFRLIFGQDYSPALWARAMGLFKVSKWLSPVDLPRRTLRRPWGEPLRREEPESVLRARGADPETPDLLNTAGVLDAEADYLTFISDIRQLLKEGRSDAEVVAALGMTSPKAEEAVAYLRQRQDPL